MKTSRLARETATIGKNAEVVGRRKTRGFAAAINGFAAGDTRGDLAVKQEDRSDDDSSPLSSLGSPSPFDIEDAPFFINGTPPKRKRGTSTPATTTTLTETSSLKLETRTPPRKAAIKTGNGSSSSSSAKIKKGKKDPAKKVIDHDSGNVTIHPPSHWEETYALVQEMRKKVLAPVDTMGCESLAEETRSPRDQRFQTLIALMLSSQTRDTTTALAITRLQTSLPPPHGFTLEGILAVDPSTLNALIHPVGFHNNKTRYIKATAAILASDFGSDIPDSVAGLISLPGVGPKMAYLCMSAAWGRDEGIGVDVHVHRITNLWGWHRTAGPEETRKALQAWLPRDKWHEINGLLVGFGQTVCLPVGRKCGECLLGTRGLCPGAVTVAQKGTVVRRKRVKVEEEGKEGKGEVEDVVVVKEEGG
ncbi:MAG: hypothetical protein LQ339_001472 [Xanthoria mediterranea]|nr:MAG: hypothetical protein LQ339_001472 [Xanthoria mediterranea]